MGKLEEKIKKGDKIMIDRGYKTYYGTFLNIKGASAFGFWGEFKIDNEIRIWDQSCDIIKKL